VSAPTRCWVAVLWSVATIDGRTTAFFILLAALNGGTIESNFPAQSISATPSFIPAETSAIGAESLGSIPFIPHRLTAAGSIPFYSLILISATQRSR